MKVIIIGAGEVGFHIAEKLCGESKDVVLIDQDSERLQQIEEQLDAQFIPGSGSSPEILQRAGIAKAGMLIAVSNQDEVNIVACMVAQHYAPNCIKIARVREPSFIKNPEVFSEQNFDLFINPEYEAAQKIARLLQVPQALDLIQFANGRVLLAGFRIEAASLLANRKMFALGDLVPNYTPLVAAIYRGKDVIVPMGSDSLRVNDIVYFTVTPEDMPKMLKLVGKKASKTEHVIIYGGSNTGLYLARLLEERGLVIKLIESDDARCTWLADRLSRTTVLHGEGMDGDLLEQENIASMDVFVSCSKDTEENILSALLAKSLGVPNAITVSNRVDYTSLLSNLGVDATISPQLAAVSRIMQFLRKGNVIAVEAIREKNAESIEFVALETSDVVGKPLSKLKFPRGALVMAVVRDEQVIIPRGDTKIEPNDRVIIFAERGAIRKVEKIFSVKLEYF